MRRVGIVLGLFVLLLGLGCLGAAAARREFDLQQYLKLPEVREHQQRNPAVAITSAALSPRRNHGCVVRPATAPQYLPLPEPQRPLEAVLFAGRWGANVEVIDFASGRHSMKTDGDVPVLNANHVAAEYVPSVDGSRQEIWIVCSFSGDKVDKEVTNKNVVIIDTNTWQARLGPALDMPRGACSSFQIDGPATGSWHYSPLAFHHHHSSSLKHTTITSHNLTSSSSSSSSSSYSSSSSSSSASGSHSSSSSSSSSSGLPEGWIKGRLVCVVGGFVGAHDKGYSVDLVSCYDRVAEKWHALPPLAHSMDHHTVLFVAGGTCADETRDRVLSISGRSGPYNTTLNRIQQLVLGEPEWTTWQLPSPFVANAASASVTQSGIIFFVGGIEYQPGRPTIRHKDITLMDVCSLKFCHSRSTLMNPKWAIVACPSPHDDWLVICGGDSTMTNSNKNSPYCETLQLPLLQEDCDQQKAWKPLASFKPK